MQMGSSSIRQRNVGTGYKSGKGSTSGVSKSMDCNTPSSVCVQTVDKRFIVETFALVTLVTLCVYSLLHCSTSRTKQALVSCGLGTITFLGLLLQLKYPSFKQSLVRPCSDSGFIYGSICVPLAIAAFELNLDIQMEIKGPKDAHSSGLLYINFNFWASVACILDTMARFILRDQNDSSSSYTWLKLLRSFISSLLACTCWSACSALQDDRSHEFFYKMVLHYPHFLIVVLLHESLFAILGRLFAGSYGELMLVNQILCLYSVDFLAFVISKESNLVAEHIQTLPVLHRSNAQIALQGGLLGVLWNAAILIPMFRKYGFRDNENNTTSFGLRDTVLFYSCIIFWLGAIVSPFVGRLLGLHPVLWVVYYTLESSEHLVIGIIWLGLLVLGLPAIHISTQKGLRLIVVRKLYHILALFLFTPAQLIAPEFLLLASGIAVAVLVLIEYTRIYRVPPFGTWLHSYMHTYTDSRDEGVVIMTHMYLLIGCTAPLWFFYNSSINPALAKICSFSGLVVLGAADAAGAMVGSSVGRFRWPGGKKTLEGTLAAVVAALFLYCLIYASLLCLTKDPSMVEIFPFEIFAAVTVFSTLFICLIEAFTKQIDNIVLPLLYPSVILVTATFFINAEEK